MAENDKKIDVYIEPGQMKTMRDPRTGQLKEVDMSLGALSRTMENIRKSAEIINSADTSFEMSMSRFAYIKELVLDHAQFSPKLQNLQIRIGNKTIDVVKHFEDLEAVRINFAKSYYHPKAKADIAKLAKSSLAQRRIGLEKVLTMLQRAKKYLGEDEDNNQMIAELESLIFF